MKPGEFLRIAALCEERKRAGWTTRHAPTPEQLAQDAADRTSYEETHAAGLREMAEARKDYWRMFIVKTVAAVIGVIGLLMFAQSLTHRESCDYSCQMQEYDNPGSDWRQ